MFRKIAIGVWASVAAAALFALLLWPESFTPGTIAEVLRQYSGEALFCYFLVSVLRGLTLLPSTPFIIAGTLLFPSEPLLVLSVSLVGIIASSSMIYWFSDLLGFGEFFEGRKPEHVRKIRERLERPAGVLFVMAWAFFPFVPTDAVCYVAGSMRMNFVKFIVAIFLGELVLCSFYVFGTRHATALLGF